MVQQMGENLGNFMTQYLACRIPFVFWEEQVLTFHACIQLFFVLSLGWAIQALVIRVILTINTWPSSHRECQSHIHLNLSCNP